MPDASAAWWASVNARRAQLKEFGRCPRQRSLLLRPVALPFAPRLVSCRVHVLARGERLARRAQGAAILTAAANDGRFERFYHDGREDVGVMRKARSSRRLPRAFFRPTVPVSIQERHVPHCLRLGLGVHQYPVSIQERHVPHLLRLGLGVHQYPVPAVQGDHPVVGMADLAPDVDISVALHARHAQRALGHHARATADHLNALGVTWLVELEERAGGLFGTLVDPDGNYVQIIELKG